MQIGVEKGIENLLVIIVSKGKEIFWKNTNLIKHLSIFHYLGID
jgi:hypothetical protein